jgi:hypothetical protein
VTVDRCAAYFVVDITTLSGPDYALSRVLTWSQDAGTQASCAHAPAMEHDQRRAGVGNVLGAAEAASPVDAVEAVTRELGLALGATSLSFLIADCLFH